MSAGGDVLSAVLERIAAGSRPGARTDSHRIALSIEGGGSRSAYSAGMAAALDEAGLLPAFDAVYGTSGGALNAAWLLTGRGAHWLPSWGWPEVLAERVTDPRRPLRGGRVVDTELLVNRVYAEVTPMDFDAILANPIGLHPIAVDLATGLAADLGPLIVDADTARQALRASAALPILAGPPPRLAERRWLDGGLVEKVPMRTPIAQGATHLLVLRTRKRSDRPRDSRVEGRILDLYFRRAGSPRPVPHDDAVPDGAAVQQIWVPESGHPVGRLSRDAPAITAAVELGRAAMRAVLARY